MIQEQLLNIINHYISNITDDNKEHYNNIVYQLTYILINEIKI
jgi:hypothetical protein